MKTEQNKVFWMDDRLIDGDNPIKMGVNNSGKSVGGSTVHFQMVSLRFRPQWFKSRSQLGYASLTGGRCGTTTTRSRTPWLFRARCIIPGGRSASAIPIADLTMG